MSMFFLNLIPCNIHDILHTKDKHNRQRDALKKTNNTVFPILM